MSLSQFVFKMEFFLFGSNKQSSQEADWQKVQMFPQINIFLIRNFGKKAQKLKSQLNTTTMHLFGNQTKYHLYVEHFCGKVSA